jgi:hypothetical protein
MSAVTEEDALVTIADEERAEDFLLEWRAIPMRFHGPLARAFSAARAAEQARCAGIARSQFKDRDLRAAGCTIAQAIERSEPEPGAPK